jgi:hypothetical protein
MSRTVAMCTCKKGTVDNAKEHKHKSYNLTEALRDDTCKYCGYYVQFRPKKQENSCFYAFSDLYTKRKAPVDKTTAFDIAKKRGWNIQ